MQLAESDEAKISIAGRHERDDSGNDSEELFGEMIQEGDSEKGGMGNSQEWIKSNRYKIMTIKWRGKNV